MHVGSVFLHVLPFLPDDLQKPGSGAINAASACDGKPPKSCVFWVYLWRSKQDFSSRAAEVIRLFSVLRGKTPPIPEDPNSTQMFSIPLHHAKIIAK